MNNNKLLDSTDMNLKIAQKKMTDMLKSFHELCCKYDIKYWCHGGTLIGTVRHKGWIPWDGDVDVGMLETDFHKFVEHSKELPKTMAYFGLYMKGLYKIRDLNSIYLNYCDGKGHTGLQLDIFVYKVVAPNTIVAITQFLKEFKEDIYKYDSIFPVAKAEFDGIEVFIPNKIKEICEYSYGGFPPPFPSVQYQTCKEGPIEPLKPAPHYLIYYKELYE
jgi:phosphorylcholine metabolism protein LicD